ncbi:MAG: TonB-dependent receptor [Gammaproteobacteria bacterium]|nr:TonB-dependent receptor [Gammaproteobacteria bacterium]
MPRIKRLNAAVMTAFAASASAPAAYAATEEIIVTATKREASAQDIPVAVQALDQAAITDLNLGNFDDVIRFLPNVSSGGRGPGQSTVYIRGMAVEPITVLLSGAQGSVPNVALYLDEQPVTAPGRNLDVYAADMQRIEVLPGPQGTLFGASSQAGTVRMITNKPNFEGFAAGVHASIADTSKGDLSSGLEAYVNLPVTETLALRGAFYNIRRGGYIDNVFGTFTTDPSINPDSNATPAAVSYDEASNLALAEDNFNGGFYQGFRLGGLYLINDDWDLLVQHTRQELGADGVFDYDPEVGDLQATRFFPDRLRDEFNLTSWTLNGRLGMLDVIYTGGYLDREINQSVDYTGYNNSGAFISYYTCTYDNPAYIVNYGIDPRFITPGGRECRTPVKGVQIYQEQERFTHELRINTPVENRWRLTAGVFYDDFEIRTQDDYLYLAVTELGFAPNTPIAGAAANNPNTRAPGVAFFNDVIRTEEQLAVFGELTLDVIPQLLEVTLGLRYYDLKQEFRGQSSFASGIFAGSIDQGSGRNYDNAGSVNAPGFDPDAPPAPGAVDPAVPGHSTDPLKLTGWIPKLTVNVTPTDDALLYFTYSEGFRPGGFNRGGGVYSLNLDFPTVPTTYDTDDVKNYEFGWKSRWLDGRLRFNGSLYYIDWTDMQVSRFDPENVSILTFIENSADSEIWGLEGDVAWAATENLTLFGAFSYNDTELKAVSAQIVELPEEGARLPLTPEFQGNVRARYDWGAVGYEWHVQSAVQYASSSFSSLIVQEREKQDSYTTLDLSAGVARDNWSAGLYIENVTDERAEVFINSQDDIRRIATNRPRTASLRFSVDF